MSWTSASAAIRISEFWEHAAAGGFLLVTKDQDFQRLSVLRGAPPKVIWIRLGNCTTADIVRLLRFRGEQLRAFVESPEVDFLALGETAARNYQEPRNRRRLTWIQRRVTPNPHPDSVPHPFRCALTSSPSPSSSRLPSPASRPTPSTSGSSTSPGGATASRSARRRRSRAATERVSRRSRNGSRLGSLECETASHLSHLFSPSKACKADRLTGAERP
jgi:predicted nuclease of predicted toxin-antitoxin system